MSGGSIIFAIKEKDLVVLILLTITQLMRCNVEWGKDFVKIDDFQGLFFQFCGTLIRFSIKVDDFGFDFDKISLSGIVEASNNITNAMVIWKQLYEKSWSFWFLQTYFTKITNAVGVGDREMSVPNQRWLGLKSNEILKINILQKFSPSALTWKSDDLCFAIPRQY